MNKKIIRTLIGLFVWLNNFSYKMISRLVVREGDGKHPKHEILKYHDFFCDNVGAADKVLDVGCGKGELANSISQKAKHIVAIDLKEGNIEFARRVHSADNINYIVGNAVKHDFLQQKFDKIVLSNVLEHIDERVNFLLKLHELSDTILLRVPLIERDWLSVYKKQVGHEYRLDPTHFIEYSVDELEKELFDAGWKIIYHKIKFGEFWGILKKYEDSINNRD